MPIELAVFSYSRMKNEMESVWNEFKSKVNIQIIEGIFDDALKCAKNLEKEGRIDVYISAGANASVLRQNVTKPVVTIRVTGFDLLRSIQNAKTYGDKIALVSFKNNIPELLEFQDLLQTPITQVIYSSEKDLIRSISRLKRSGFNTVVGHSLACDLAEKHGMRSVLLYTRESVRQAIETACELALSTRHETEKAERLKTILDYVYSGVIATDSQGAVTVFNKGAEEIIGLSADEAIGQPIDRIIPNTRINHVIHTEKPELNQLQKIGSSYIFTNRAPIRAHNELVGVVATFQSVSTIQNAEGQIRKNLHNKGLVAKFTFDDIIGKSPLLLRTVERAQKFSQTESTILITGETGSGKELLAQGIHNHSPRRMKPFVAVNCSALPGTLLESELFGYEEGAFTGAKRGGKTGLFELAHTGTIFLDEIGEIPPSLQSSLLRVLQEREIMRVGSDRIIPVDVRVVSATNRDLRQAVKDGKMREDLYYRLNVLHVKSPPLREREGDTMLLARHYLSKFNPEIMKHPPDYVADVLSVLEAYRWPGNVRELQNVMERFSVLIKDSDMSPERLRECLNEALEQQSPPEKETSPLPPPASSPLLPPTKDISAETILRTLAQVNGNRSQAARLLGISRMTIWRKLSGQ